MLTQPSCAWESATRASVERISHAQLGWDVSNVPLELPLNAWPSGDQELIRLLFRIAARMHELTVVRWIHSAQTFWPDVTAHTKVPYTLTSAVKLSAISLRDALSSPSVTLQKTSCVPSRCGTVFRHLRL